MSPPHLRIRRATTDDFQNLKALWDSRQLPADDLEKRKAFRRIERQGV